MRGDPFVTSDVSDAQNCGKTRILRLTLATLSWFRACRTLKTVVKRKFFTSPRNPFVISCVSNAQNCDKTHIFHVAEQPFRYFVRVGCSKLWQNGRFWPDWIGLRSKTEVKWTFWTTEVKWGVVVFHAGSFRCTCLDKLVSKTDVNFQCYALVWKGVFHVVLEPKAHAWIFWLF